MCHTIHISIRGLHHSLHRGVYHGVLHAGGYLTVHNMECHHHCIYHDVLAYVVVCLPLINYLTGSSIIHVIN